MKLLGISSSKLAPIAFLFSILVATLILSNVDFLKVGKSATLPSFSEGLSEGVDEDEEEGMEGEEKEEEGMEGEEKKEKTPEEVLAAASVEGFEGFNQPGKHREYASVSA
jgi:hypothetical protein